MTEEPAPVSPRKASAPRARGLAVLAVGLGCTSVLGAVGIALILLLGSAYAGGGHGGAPADVVGLTIMLVPPALLAAAFLLGATGVWRGRNWGIRLLLGIDLLLFSISLAFLLLVTLPAERPPYPQGDMTVVIGVGTVTSLCVLGAAVLLGIALLAHRYGHAPGEEGSGATQDER